MFSSKQNPSKLGILLIPDAKGINIRCKMNTTSDKLMENEDTKAYYRDLPADLLACKHLMFVYANIIEYRYVVDAKTPDLRVIDSQQPLKNGEVCEFKQTHQIAFRTWITKSYWQTQFSPFLLNCEQKRWLDSLLWSKKNSLDVTIQKIFKLKWIQTTQIKQILCRIFPDTIHKEVAALELWFCVIVVLLYP